ncbi:uncharacterized protein LOC130994080 [Salvia miltiorrhiza]|uniref:uncharacterized protein LOC130994080 n=1 Tax=Salvia miltiorrhiza TaxID=226208 RepID=UPI0025AD94B0|nr:uncharacterized protein LOC130994080 [Salvia miltiorrhiza]
MAINESFPDEQIWAVLFKDPWYADYSNYLVIGALPEGLSHYQKKKFLHDVKFYYWEDPYLYRRCADGFIRRCVREHEWPKIIEECHSSPSGGHFAANRTAMKVNHSGFYWPSIFADCHAFVKSYDRCQRMGNITKRDEMPQNIIVEVELFDVWGIDFMGPFPPSCGFSYILLAVEYVSRWVEAIPTVTNDSKIICDVDCGIDNIHEALYLLKDLA